MMSTNNGESDYLKSLSSDIKARYYEKTKIVMNMNPYSLTSQSLSSDVGHLPKLTYIDIVNYFVYERSAYTKEEFKAYKSLEAYNQFVCGWVKYVGCHQVNDYVIIVGKVLHSQRLREKPALPWLICRNDGEIMSAHCDCKAGLGETCTHIGAVTFFIDDITHYRKEKTVTDVAAYWNAPSSKIKKTDRNINCKVPFMTISEMKSSLSILANENVVCALHAVVSPYAEKINKKNNLLVNSVPQQAFLKNLFDADLCEMDLEYLKIAGKTLDLSLNADACDEIEKNTRLQSNDQAWYQFRLGRITASNMKACTRTKINNPSYSLISKICNIKLFQSKYTAYGCKHEEDAIKKYHIEMISKHENFEIRKSGFIIHPSMTYIGATPDGIVSCDCCGCGCLEVKCPYCAIDATFEELSEEKKQFCLQNVNGKMSLKTDHSYFYQIQTQMAVTQSDFCDFVVWSEKELHTERIRFLPDFWKECFEKATAFFYEVIVVELIAKYFSQKRNTN